MKLVPNDKDWFDEAGAIDKELFAQVTYRHIASASAKFDNALRNKTRERLADLGHKFDTDAELFEFCSKRVHNVAYEDRPYYREIWLDLPSNTKSATFLFFYKTEVKTEYLNGEIITTIG